VRTNGYGIPVVSLDVDGTIADYHGHFLRFAEGYFGKPFPSELTINPGLRLHHFMGIEHADYQKCKLAYRQGGLKRSMPPLRGIGDVIRQVRVEWATEVWICTTRPFNSLSSLEEDTIEFLKRAGVGYDAIIIDPISRKDKYWELTRQSEGRVCAVVEDLPEQAWRAHELGLGPILIRNQPYNQISGENDAGLLPPNAIRWSTAEELRDLLRTAVYQWKERRRGRHSAS
jgi:hypothetical protein